jgi:hypothetical protein
MVMASTTLPETSDRNAARQHSVRIESYSVTGSSQATRAVVERLNGRFATVCCTNLGLSDEDLEREARRYARMYDAVLLPPEPGPKPAPELSDEEQRGAEEHAARTRLVASLRELASFLAVHPEVPVPDHRMDLGFAVSPDGGDEAAIARVRAAAAALGVEAVEPAPGYWRAERTFGQVSYGCGYIARRTWAEAQATQSYEGAVVPDGSSS